MIKTTSGLHDLTTYSVKPFLAGDESKFNILDNFKPNKKLVPKLHKEITVSVPARLTTTIIDTNDLSIKRPGGGMFGIGVDGFKTIIQIKLNKVSKQTKIVGIDVPVVKHVLLLLSYLCNSHFEVEVKVKQKTQKHIGLASNSTLSLAVAIGFNELLGTPFSNRQLRKILGYNYVENHSSKKVCFGLNVGTSQALGMYGGMIILTSEAEIVCHNYLPKTEKILLYVPKNESVKKKISGINELKRVLTDVRKLDRWQSQGRVYHIFMELIPRVNDKNMMAIGNIVNDFLTQGHQYSLLTEIYDVSTLEAILAFRSLGGNICGISSGGPTIFATGEKEVLIKIKGWLVKNRNASKKEIFILNGSQGTRIHYGTRKKKQYKLNPLEK